MERRLTREEKQRRNNAAFLVAIIMGILLVVAGLSLAALYGSMNWLYTIPALISFAVITLLSKRFGYLFN